MMMNDMVRPSRQLAKSSTRRQSLLWRELSPSKDNPQQKRNKT